MEMIYYPKVRVVPYSGNKLGKVLHTGAKLRRSTVCPTVEFVLAPCLTFWHTENVYTYTYKCVRGNIAVFRRREI